MPADDPPRRRVSDRERRRWPDAALDQLSERVDASDDRFASLDRRMSEVRTDLAQTNERLARIERTLNESFARNFREHQAVRQTTEQIAKTVAPTRWDKVKDFAAIVSTLLVPVLVAIIGVYAVTHS